MKKILHKLFTALLLACFGIMTMFYLFFDAAQVGCKIDAHKQIAADTRIEVLKIPIAEYRSMQQQDEIWYYGELYDICSIKIVDEIAYVSVYHDTKEEILVKIEVDSIDPDKRLATGSIDHFSKHRIHVFDNDKIAGVCFEFNIHSAAIFLSANFPYSVSYPPLVFSSVIKPPPRHVLA